MIGADDHNGNFAAMRAAEIAAAREQAKAIRRAADSRAERIVAQARADASALIGHRCAAAARLAEIEERDRLAEIRTQARETVLRAQQSVLSEARAAAQAVIREMVGDPRMVRLFERLAADARERLVHAGHVEITVLAEGGFVARAGSREIDYSLSSHLDRWLDAMAGELESLWQ